MAICIPYFNSCIIYKFYVACKFIFFKNSYFILNIP